MTRKFERPSGCAGISAAPSVVAPPVHRSGKTETEGPKAQGVSAPQYRTIPSWIAHREAASGTQASTLRFVLVATLSLIEVLLYRDTYSSVAYLSAATFLLFLMFAVQAPRINRAGNLLALTVYGVSTTAMAVIAMTSEYGIGLVFKPLIVRCALLYALYRRFELQDDAQVLQNSH